MIPGSFAYHRPKTVPEAVALLTDLEDARPLAGGHSLIPVMKLRLGTPANLVDLGGIADLKGIRASGTEIVIGAMTTQFEIIHSDLLSAQVPILKDTAKQIADPQVRYMGTIGGNAANGDPSNDMPAIMMALNANYVLTGKSGDRLVPAREFYQGIYMTSLQPGEVLTAIHITAPPKGHGYAYNKLKRKIGDYATAASAVILTLAGGKVASAAVTLSNVGDTALYAEEASKLLVGSSLDAATIAKARAAAEKITSPASDNHGPAAYRTKVAGVMFERAVALAKQRAGA